MSDEKPKQQQPTEWVAPLVRAMLMAPVVKDSYGPITCPICECDHQVFQGTGVLGVDKKGTHLVCAFPSTETICKIDMPPDIKVGGLVTYIRYICACGGHAWAMMTAFMQDHTTCWCANLTPQPTKKKCGKKQPPQNPTLQQTLQNMVQGMAAGGHKPLLVLGPGVLSQLSPEAIAQLQAQGAVINPHLEQPPLQVPGLKGGPPEKLPPPNLGPENDHEHPLNRLPPTVRYAWQNWGDKEPVAEDQIFNFQLPKVPIKRTDDGEPPYLAVGTTDSKLLTPMQEWVFSLAVEIDTNISSVIHALVYWENLLLVVTNAPQPDRKAVAQGVANGVINLKKFKPDLYLLTKRDYSVLVRSKAAQAKKAK